MMLIKPIISLVLINLATTTLSFKISPIVPKDATFKYPLTLGEGPHWDADQQELYFVDIQENTVFRYVPDTDEFFSIKLDGRVTPVVPIQNRERTFVVGVELGFWALEWDGVSSTPNRLDEIASLPYHQSHRLNDGKCDPSGRLWAGTMDESGNPNPDGSLYSLNQFGQVAKGIGGIGTSNGMAWAPDNRTMYYIDTPTARVDALDFDITTGEISNRRTAFDFRENGIWDGSPDGMTIDSFGNLWVCMWGGSSIHHINPTTSTLLGTVDFTGIASLITSAAFSGPNLDYLLVTSANSNSASESNPGHLFKVTELGSARGLSGGVNYVYSN